MRSKFQKTRKNCILSGSFECKPIQIFSGESGLPPLRSGDPRVGGLQSNECPFAARTRIFVLHIRCEPARASVPNKNARQSRDIHLIGGESGIRTRDTLSSIHTFQACSFNHSDTSP